MLGSVETDSWVKKHAAVVSIVAVAGVGVVVLLGAACWERKIEDGTTSSVIYGHSVQGHWSSCPR
jgi:hypothetical protein